MKRSDGFLVLVLLVLMLSLFGNVFAISHYFGQQSVLKSYDQNNAKLGTVESFTFRDLALSLSPEGREILTGIFMPRLPEIMQARAAVKEKRKATQLLIDSENFTEEEFLDAIADAGGAQEKSHALMQDLFVEVIIALPPEDRKILAKNFKKVILSSLIEAHQNTNSEDTSKQEGTE